MNKLSAPPVPEPTSDWIAARRDRLVREITAPHQRPIPHRLALSAVGVLAVVGAATVAVLFAFAGAHASNAFAGWTAKPTQPLKGQVQTAQAGCNQPDQPTLADTRGPYAVLLYNTPGQPIYACTAFPAASGGTQFVGGSTNQQTLGSSLAANTIAIAAHGMRTDAADRSVYQRIYGYAGGDVTSVTLVLNDGTQVQATTENGLFEAWWPGTQGVQNANVTATTGTYTQQVDIPSVTLPPGIWNNTPSGTK